ncbi:MAG: outer membrane protein transport protein [Balneolaceae bacterium]|nr:outer membrane protein transport protein [Balneolaceae bacterium]
MISSLFAITSYAQTGHVMSGVGAIDQSMSGAGTVALPLDGLSGIYANPSTLTQFDGLMLDVSLQIMQPSGTLYSTVQENAFGPSFPNATISGATESTAGPFPIPALAITYMPEKSNWAFGFSAYGVGGFGVDYEMTPTNPITTPQAPNGFGFGAIPSEFQLLQMAPTVAYRLSPNFSIGFSPLVNRSALEVRPFPAATPDDGNGDGFFSYPDGPKTSAWGFGYSVGLNLRNVSDFHFGVSYKSIQHFEDLNFNSTDEAGNPRSFAFNLDYPSILTGGFSYTGINRVLMAFDVKYIDFARTDGFEKKGYDATGAVQGFGWNSIYVYTTGIQYQLTDRLPVRFGYSYNTCPIDHDDSFFNVSAPAIIQHHISTGASYDITSKVQLNAAFQYGFKNSTEGQWISPQGSMTGTEVRNELSTSIFVIGLTFDVQ